MKKMSNEVEAFMLDFRCNSDQSDVFLPFCSYSFVFTQQVLNPGFNTFNYLYLKKGLCNINVNFVLITCQSQINWPFNRYVFESENTALVNWNSTIKQRNSFLVLNLSGYWIGQIAS